MIVFGTRSMKFLRTMSKYDSIKDSAASTEEGGRRTHAPGHVSHAVLHSWRPSWTTRKDQSMPCGQAGSTQNTHCKNGPYL